MLKFNEIVKFADKCIYNVEHKQTASIDSVRNYTTLAYLFSKAILRIGKDTGIKRIKENKKRVGYPLDKNVNKNSYLEACRWYVTWCDNHQDTAPSHVQIDKGVAIWVWTYATARIIRYYNTHKQLPNTVYLTNKPFRKEPTVDDVYSYFVSKFGKVGSIDEALEKVQGAGYGYYYDDVYSNRTSIDRMKQGLGVNCTDSCQVFWHIGKQLGYQVRCIHVLCSGGDGHVRLQFNKGNGWFDRDPAAVLNGSDVTHIWCSTGTVLAVNPDWFMENLNR